MKFLWDYKVMSRRMFALSMPSIVIATRTIIFLYKEPNTEVARYKNILLPSGARLAPSL